MVTTGRRLMAQVDPVRTALLLLVPVVLFGVLGALEDNGAPLGLFDLDGEGKPPAAYSALMLLAAGAAALFVAADAAERSRTRWRVLGGFFIFMALDEALTVHEHLSDLTGVGWITLYAPVVLVAAIAAVACLLTLRDVVAGAVVLCAGGLSWFVAQVLEQLESNPDEGRVEGYWIYATFEECLETAGSILFFVACVVIYQRRRARAAV
jgi:hypothetical protein